MNKLVVLSRRSDLSLLTFNLTWKARFLMINLPTFPSPPGSPSLPFPLGFLRPFLSSCFPSPALDWSSCLTTSSPVVSSLVSLVSVSVDFTISKPFSSSSSFLGFSFLRGSFLLEYEIKSFLWARLRWAVTALSASSLLNQKKERKSCRLDGDIFNLASKNISQALNFTLNGTR